MRKTIVTVSAALAILGLAGCQGEEARPASPSTVPPIPEEQFIADMTEQGLGPTDDSSYASLIEGAKSMCISLRTKEINKGEAAMYMYVGNQETNGDMDLTDAAAVVGIVIRNFCPEQN